MNLERVYLDGIETGERMRPLIPERIAALKSSIKEIGLRTPLTVMAQRDGVDTRMILVTGKHRLEALRQLGEEATDCFVIADDEIDARLWEIAENLHRVDLSKEQRDEHIRQYAALLEEKQAMEVSQQNASKPKSGPSGGRPKSVSTKVAEQVGLSKDTVRRALKPKPDNDQAAASRKSKIDADVKDRATREAAEIIAEYVPGEAWDGLKANLYASGAKALADALTNITGNSVMDRRSA